MNFWDAFGIAVISALVGAVAGGLAGYYASYFSGKKLADAAKTERQETIIRRDLLRRCQLAEGRAAERVTGVEEWLRIRDEGGRGSNAAFRDSSTNQRVDAIEYLKPVNEELTELLLELQIVKIDEKKEPVDYQQYQRILQDLKETSQRVKNLLSRAEAYIDPIK